MNLAAPKTAWRVTLTISAILLAGIVGYSIFSIARAMRGGDQAQGIAGTTAGQTPAAAAPEATPPAAEAAPATDSRNNLPQEFETLRQREQGRQEMINNLRQQARENPDDPGTLSKERIDALEKSGDSLM